jgi:cell division protein ZapA (FtsZ GTPase activity inhibitor)
MKILVNEIKDEKILKEIEKYTDDLDEAVERFNDYKTAYNAIEVITIATILQTYDINDEAKEHLRKTALTAENYIENIFKREEHYDNLIKNIAGLLPYNDTLRRIIETRKLNIAKQFKLNSY